MEIPSSRVSVSLLALIADSLNRPRASRDLSEVHSPAKRARPIPAGDNSKAQPTGLVRLVRQSRVRHKETIP